MADPATSPKDDSALSSSTTVVSQGENGSTIRTTTTTTKRVINRTATSSSSSSDGSSEKSLSSTTENLTASTELMDASTFALVSNSTSATTLATTGKEEQVVTTKGGKEEEEEQSSSSSSLSTDNIAIEGAGVESIKEILSTSTTNKKTTSSVQEQQEEEEQEYHDPRGGLIRGESSDDSSWILEPRRGPKGKRNRHYRTKEGREAAEKCKHYKSGLTVPHLSANCNSYQGILKHALLGALRSGGLTYLIKALINLCLGTLKVMKGKASVSQIAKDAFAGEDAIRFGSFFGMFSFLWKFVNNTLRLYRGVDDRVNGMIAGAVAGLSLLIEGRQRRVTFAQQMFMRSIQGVYNAGKHRGIVSWRHGDALLFAIGSAQIMYGYAMHPDTIPELFSFMVKTAKVPSEALAFNRLTTRGMPLDINLVTAMVERFKGTPTALATASAMTETSKLLPCAVLHPYEDSCTRLNFVRFLQVTKNIFPVYATLNFVPLMILRLKRFLKDPVNIGGKTVFNTLRSSVFLAVFVVLYQTQICTHRNLTNWGIVNSNSKYLYWFFGLTCSGTAIFVEQESRRAELAMYTLPKAAASLYKILYRKKWVKGVKNLDVAVFSAAMGLIMSFYQQEEQVLSPFVTKMIYHLLGKN